MFDFDKIFDFRPRFLYWPKFRFVAKIQIFDRKFSPSTEVYILGQNFDVRPKLGLYVKFKTKISSFFLKFLFDLKENLANN